MVHTAPARTCASVMVVARRARSRVEKVNAMILRPRCAAPMGLPVTNRTCVSMAVAAQRAKRPVEINATIQRPRCAALIRRPPARKGTSASRVISVALPNTLRSAARIGAIIRRQVSAAPTRKTLEDGRARRVMSAAICLEAATTPTPRSAVREVPVWKASHVAARSVVLRLRCAVRTDSAQQQSRILSQLYPRRLYQSPPSPRRGSRSRRRR